MKPLDNRSFWYGVTCGLTGALIGHFIVAALPTEAFDPCDQKPQNHNRSQDNRLYYEPQDDAAMQFHWQDGQPSLHPR